MANATLTCPASPSSAPAQSAPQSPTALIGPKEDVCDAQIQDLCDAAYHGKHHKHAGCAPATSEEAWQLRCCRQPVLAWSRSKAESERRTNLEDQPVSKLEDPWERDRGREASSSRMPVLLLRSEFSACPHVLCPSSSSGLFRKGVGY